VERHAVGDEHLEVAEAKSRCASVGNTKILHAVAQEKIDIIMTLFSRRSAQ